MPTLHLLFRVLLIGGLVWSTAVSAEAAPRGARRARQQQKAYVIQLRIRQEAVASAQAQYAAGQATLNAANGREANAAARMSSAIGEVRSVAEELRQARTIENELQKDLADVEHEILSEQPPGSNYVKAQAEAQSLREEVKRRETQLLQASAYIAKKAALLTESDGRAAVARFRQETLERDPQFAELQRKLAQATGEVARIKQELFAADAEWKETHEAFTAARKVTRSAGNEVELASPGRLEIANDLREARSAANAARGVVSQAEAVLGRYNAPATPATKSAGKK